MAAINTGEDIVALCQSDDPQHPANLIPELCRLFYTLGWVTGTGGGISIRDGYVLLDQCCCPLLRLYSCHH